MESNSRQRTDGVARNIPKHWMRDLVEPWLGSLFLYIGLSIIFACSVFWQVTAPIEFGSFNSGPPMSLRVANVALSVIFLVYIVLEHMLAYKDAGMKINIKAKLWFVLARLRNSPRRIVDLLAIVPWDLIYVKPGVWQVFRFLLLLRLVKIRHILRFFSYLHEEDNYYIRFGSRVVKLALLYLYWFNIGAGWLLYAASMVQRKDTWMKSLTNINFLERYVNSLYFAFVTLTTVGYGDYHAVSQLEMLIIIGLLSVTFSWFHVITSHETEIMVEMMRNEKKKQPNGDEQGNEQGCGRLQA